MIKTARINWIKVLQEGWELVKNIPWTDIGGHKKARIDALEAKQKSMEAQIENLTKVVTELLEAE